MVASYRPEIGDWWRFDRYIIEDGAIRPAEGSRLSTYDPWADYEASRLHGGGQEAPYQTLLSLVQQLRFDATNTLTPESASLLCEWCSSYGLLGILTQEYDHLPMRFLWDRETIAPPEDYKTAGPEGLRVDPHILGAWLWNPPNSWGEIPYWIRTILNYREGPQVAPSRALYSYMIHASECIESPDGYKQPLISKPLTEQFWRDYQEPVAEFVERARDLTASLKHLASPIPPDIRDGGWAVWQDGKLDLGYIDFWDDITYLNELTSTASFGVQIDATGKPQRILGFRSLLGTLALMILQDVTGGRMVRVCANCGAPFTSTSPKAAYCSVRCRNTAQKRRQRNRARDKGAKP